MDSISAQVVIGGGGGGGVGGGWGGKWKPQKKNYCIGGAIKYKDTLNEMQAILQDSINQ